MQISLFLSNGEPKWILDLFSKKVLQMAYEGKKYHKWVKIDILFGKIYPSLNDKTSKIDEIPPKPPNAIRITIKYKCRHKRTKPSIEEKIYRVK